MAAVSQKIPNLLGGVSQQPDPVKLPGQVRSADNVYLDPTFGCRKRPGSEYIATIAGSDVPEDARWFSIFRDNNERYAVALYTKPSLVLRVWDLNDGSERSVTISESASAYFSGATQDTVEQISIADYTLLTNVNAKVSMNTDTSATTDKAALITVDQIAYNTTYSVDLAKDGDDSTSRVYTATGIEVIPGSYERDDGGVCSESGAQTFTESASGKSGLSFRLVNQCTSYLLGGSKVQRKVKKVRSLTPPDNIKDARAVTQFDGFKGDWLWGFPLFKADVFDAEWQERDSRIGDTVTDDHGGQVVIEKEEVRQFSDARYMSRHKVDVQLLNGGVGWRKGDYRTVTMNGRSYTIRVTSDRYTYAYNSAGTAAFTTPVNSTSGTLDIGAVVSGLTTSLDGLPNFKAVSVGSVIRVTRVDGRDFNVSVRGGTTNKAMNVIKGLASDVSELPNQCFDNYLVKVTNTDDAEADDYYVRFESESPGIPGSGSWVETVAPGIKTTINSSTMPHALIRQANGSFKLDALDTSSAFGGWAQREVGDEKTNPEPTFVGRGISNMFFFANRLGFLSEDAVIMSQPGDYFNFFSGSALAVSDADPIDLTASSTIPAILKGVVGTPKGLVLFAERSQFLLASNEIAFSSSTVKMTEISNYFYRSKVLPLNSGVSISFISESLTYSKVMEMAVDSVENRPQVADITRIIPEYLPPDLIWGEVLPNNNMLVYGEGTEEVFVFKFFNNGDERQLAGWTRWIYPGKVKLFAAEDDLYYTVQYDGSKYILCKSELTDDPDQASINAGFSSFTPRLDVSLGHRRFTESSYSTKQSRVRFKDDAVISGAKYVLITTAGPGKGAFVEVEVKTDGTGPYFITENHRIVGDYVVGCGYDASVELPGIYVKSDNKADRVNVPMVSFVHLDLYYSGRYEVTLSRLGYDDVVKSIEIPAANIYDADAIPVTEIGEVSVPVFSPGNISRITIKAPDPFPSSITGYSWEGSYNNRGVRPLR